MDKSLKRSKEILELIEEEFNLFEMNICGVKFWQYIRFLIFSAIQGTFILKKSHNWKTWLKRILFLLKHCFYKNALLGKKKDILIFNHPRRKIIDGQYWAIYTDFLIKSGGLGSNYQVLELYYEDRKLSMIKETKLLDFVQTMAFLYRIFIKVRFNERELSQLKQLENRIKNDFCIKLNIVLLIKKKIREIKSYFWIMDKLLDIYQPKLIIEVAYYDRILMVLNELCKKRGIPTIEFQHGLIGPLHIAYDFPANKNVNVFPDYFFSFGKFWEEKTNLPIDRNKIITVGFPYQEMESKKYLKKSNSDIILFISQGTIGEKLSKLAVKFAKNTNYKVIYKLHPREYSSWENDYPCLITNVVKVIDNDEIPLYKLLADSYAQVGVYSTVIFEGLCYGLKTFIVKFQGSEALSDIVKNGYGFYIRNYVDLLNGLEIFKGKTVNCDYFFKKNSVKNQIESIKKVLETDSH